MNRNIRPAGCEEPLICNTWCAWSFTVLTCHWGL